jgi:hypothetical protein
VSGTSYAVSATHTGLVGGDGKVYACVTAKTGTVRVVKRGTRCRRREQALSWNQQGPKGDPSPGGAKGETGAPGAQGAPGADGSAIAFARVSEGTLDASRSKHVLGVAASCKDNLPGDCAFRQPAKMCFDLGFKPRNAVATVEASLGGSESDFGIATATVSPSASAGIYYWPAGFTDAAVVTLDSSTNLYASFAFYVTFN